MTHVNDQSESEQVGGDFLRTKGKRESVHTSPDETCVRTYRHGLVSESNAMERNGDLQTSLCLAHLYGKLPEGSRSPDPIH